MKFWLGVVVLLSVYGGTGLMFVGVAVTFCGGNLNLLAGSAGLVWAGSLLGRYVETIKD